MVVSSWWLKTSKVTFVSIVVACSFDFVSFLLFLVSWLLILPIQFVFYHCHKFLQISYRISSSKIRSSLTQTAFGLYWISLRNFMKFFISLGLSFPNQNSDCKPSSPAKGFHFVMQCVASCHLFEKKNKAPFIIYVF